MLGTTTVPDAPPVSYTHLDVYKRQTPYYPDEQDKTEIEKKWKRIAITNFLYRMSGKKKISTAYIALENEEKSCHGTPSGQLSFHRSKVTEREYDPVLILSASQRLE